MTRNVRGSTVLLLFACPQTGAVHTDWRYDPKFNHFFLAQKLTKNCCAPKYLAKVKVKLRFSAPSAGIAEIEQT